MLDQHLHRPDHEERDREGGDFVQDVDRVHGSTVARLPRVRKGAYTAAIPTPPKYREVRVRFPAERGRELDEIARERGVQTGTLVRVITYDWLRAQTNDGPTLLRPAAGQP